MARFLSCDGCDAEVMLGNPYSWTEEAQREWLVDKDGQHYCSWACRERSVSARESKR